MTEGSFKKNEIVERFGTEEPKEDGQNSDLGAT